MSLLKLVDKYSAKRPNKDILYSDFLANLNFHPDSKQLINNINEAAVIRSIKNLLLTNKYERLFQPTIGCNLNHFLFEDISPQTQASIKTQVIQTIENYEPRAKLLDVIVTPYPDENGYVITIIFYLITISNTVTVNIPLRRVR